jgi:hypothetical protein
VVFSLNHRSTGPLFLFFPFRLTLLRPFFPNRAIVYEIDPPAFLLFVTVSCDRTVTFVWLCPISGSFLSGTSEMIQKTWYSSQPKAGTMMKSFESFLRCETRSCPEKVKHLTKHNGLSFWGCQKIRYGIENLSGQSLRNESQSIEPGTLLDHFSVQNYSIVYLIYRNQLRLVLVNHARYWMEKWPCNVPWQIVNYFRGCSWYSSRP